MGADLVFRVGEHVEVYGAAAVYDLVQFGVGAAKQHPSPMLPVLLHIRRKIP